VPEIWTELSPTQKPTGPRPFDDGFELLELLARVVNPSFDEYEFRGLDYSAVIPLQLGSRSMPSRLSVPNIQAMLDSQSAPNLVENTKQFYPLLIYWKNVWMYLAASRSLSRSTNADTQKRYAKLTLS
jgi:hypothetical protein